MATVVKENSSTIGALDAASTVIDISDVDFVGVQILGTFTGTVSFYISPDNVTWYLWAMHSTAQTNATTDASSTTIPAIYTKPNEGMKYFKTVMTAYTSGSATVKALCTRYGK